MNNDNIYAYVYNVCISRISVQSGIRAWNATYGGAFQKMQVSFKLNGLTKLF